MNVKKSETGVPVFNRFALIMLHLYKRGISPLLPRGCRFYPTCSDYASLCFEKFSFFRALGLSARRLARCQPFCQGGPDPVP